MRLCMSLLLVASFACKKKEADSPPAGGSGSGSAAVSADAPAAVAAAAIDAGVAGVFCSTEDDQDAGLRVLASDDKSVTFCWAKDEGEPKCARLDIASGAFTLIAPAKAPDKPAAKAPDVAKLDLPKSEGWMLATSPDGKTIAATSGEINGQLFILDAATGKQRKVVTFKEADGGCMEEPQFLGDNIYTQYNVCAGPGATGVIVSPKGKRLANVEAVNPTGKFIPVGGTQYAFEDFGGTTIQIVDAATGKTVRTIELDDKAACGEDRDAVCPARSPYALGLVKAGAKLVQLGSWVAVIDPATGKIEKNIRYPACEKKP
jgi:hypothetical protein